MKLVFIVLMLNLSIVANCQINAYAKVTAISSTAISVSNPNETYASFQVNEQVIIMQMQDDVIGANTNNDISFGNLSSIASAGQYEYATISAITRSTGVLTSIT